MPGPKLATREIHGTMNDDPAKNAAATRSESALSYGNRPFYVPIESTARLV